MTATDATTKTEPQSSNGWSLFNRTSHTFALAFWFLTLILCWRSFYGLARLSFQDERSSHVLLIPLLSLGLIWWQRKLFFRAPSYCPALGVPLLLTAIVLWFGLKTRIATLNDTDRLSVVAFLIVLAWIAGFILFYGIGSFKAAAFPLGFLLLMIPLPVAFADHAVFILQKGSAETCYVLFHLLGVPVIRHDFLFALPGVDIEVAKQCSGIHSALSLFITGLLTGHLLLQSTRRKVLFAFCLFPIAILKNAMRIVTIAWLGVHVNPDFFSGPLHHRGGLPFAVPALVMMFMLLWLLRYRERKGSSVA